MTLLFSKTPELSLDGMSTVYYKDEQWFFGGYTNGKLRQMAKLIGCRIELLPNQLPFDGTMISSHVYNLRKVVQGFKEIRRRNILVTV